MIGATLRESLPQEVTTGSDASPLNTISTLVLCTLKLCTYQELFTHLSAFPTSLGARIVLVYLQSQFLAQSLAHSKTSVLDEWVEGWFNGRMDGWVDGQ